MDINKLRSFRNNDFAKIATELEKTANPEQKSYVDDRVWKPERDKAGNATATIRFLPRTIKDDESDELPWVKIWSHAFKGPSGKWYIENSLTTLGQEDPCGQLNSKLFNSTTDDESPARKQARAQKRKLTYTANILVIDDPKHPENNNQVRLFKFGKKIFDKIMDKARPTFEDEEPVNVFDYWEGANFKLRMKQVEGYPNYDTSAFGEPTPIAKSDEAILEIANKQYLLKNELAPSNFKSYDELKKKLEWVLNGDANDMKTATEVADTRNKVASKPSPLTIEDDEEELQSYFTALANAD